MTPVRTSSIATRSSLWCPVVTVPRSRRGRRAAAELLRALRRHVNKQKPARDRLRQPGAERVRGVVVGIVIGHDPLDYPKSGRFPNSLLAVDLDLPRPGFFAHRQGHRQHAVTVFGAHPPGIHRAPAT